MLDLTTVQYEIERWIETFVEVPHPALGGWAPCPYARKARLDRDFEVRIGNDLVRDLIDLSDLGITKSVTILVYEREKISHDVFSHGISWANTNFLLYKNLLALEDHPDDQEVVNGVCMNQGTYALALVQSVPDLNEKAKLVARKGFYDNWPEDYLQELFKHREDPRK